MMFVLTVRSEVDSYIGIDYSLLSDPVVTSKGMDMHFRVNPPALICYILLYSILLGSNLSCPILIYSVMLYSIVSYVRLLGSVHDVMAVVSGDVLRAGQSEREPGEHGGGPDDPGERPHGVPGAVRVLLRQRHVLLLQSRDLPDAHHP